MSLTDEPVICARCHREIRGADARPAMVVRKGGAHEMIPIEDVFSVRAEHKGLTFERNNGTTWFDYGTLYAFLETHGQAFTRLSKSTVLRVSAIRSLRYSRAPGANARYCAETHDGRRLTISRRQWTRVLEQARAADAAAHEEPWWQ